MELSKKERLFLYNQYEILKLLNSDDDYMVKQYEINQEILLNGYQRNYDDMIEWVLDDTPEDVSEFVWDVLQMYRTLYTSYSALSPDEKKQLDVSDIKYSGFDGNEESDYYMYANFVLEKLGRYEEIYNKGNYTANSHSNIIYRYAGMLERWNELGMGRYANLSLEQIKKVVG